VTAGMSKGIREEKRLYQYTKEINHPAA